MAINFRHKGLQIAFILIVISLIAISLRQNQLQLSKYEVKQKLEKVYKVEGDKEKKFEAPINIVLIGCGNDTKLFNYSANFLKTSFLFAKKPIKFTIFANDVNKKFISETVEKWPLNIKQKHIIEFREPTYPIGYESWRNFFVPCASLRLFLPDLMPDVDSAIYLDTDILVMSDLHELWDEFARFKPRQMLALAQEREIWNKNNWYTDKTHVKFPVIPPFGSNAGVLLMNFTRLRDFSFFKKIELIYNQYKEQLFLHDQDLLNILGYYNPDIIYRLDCRFNFLPYHCVPQMNCLSVEKENVKLIHGAGGIFIGGRIKAFKEQIFEDLFNTINTYDFTNSMRKLIGELKESAKNMTQKKCVKYIDVLIKPLVELNLD